MLLLFAPSPAATTTKVTPASVGASSVGTTAVGGARVFVAASSGITGTLTGTETTETGGLSGGIVGTGTIAGTETAETGDLSGSVSSNITGSITGTETAETGSLSGGVVGTGTIAGTETAETGGLSGLLAVVGTIAGTETADGRSLSGTVAGATATGTLTGTETAETGGLSGSVVGVGTIAGTETAETGGLSGSVVGVGTIAGTETAETGGLSGAVFSGAVTGTLTGTELADIASLSGSLPAIGTLGSVELPDVSSLSGLYLTTAQILGQPQKNALTAPVPPNLPLAPLTWDPRFQEQFSNVLRLYFNQVSGQLQQMMRPLGGQYTNSPHGAFHDTTRQTAVSTTTAYVITLNTTDFANGVTVPSGGQITAGVPAVYNLQISAQLANATNAPVDIDIWVRKNGIDVPATNSRIGLGARKSVGDPYHTVFAANYLLPLAAGDYVQFVWSTTDVNAYIEAYAAGTSPTRPSIPSVIATMTFVSSSV